MKKTPITEAEILAATTPKGGWTAKQLAKWGIPWPPPHGWKAQLIRYGYPYDPDLVALDRSENFDSTAKSALERMMEKNGGELDPAKLLRIVVSAIISAGHASDLYEFPEVLAFFGAQTPPSNSNGID